MKKLLTIGLIFTFLISFVPPQTLAAVNDTELEPYLAQLGWTKEELETYLLENYEFSIEEFVSFKELNGFLGDVLTEEKFSQLLLENNLTKEELKAQLVEYGDMKENEDIFDVYPFYDDLASLIEYYSEMTKITEENLTLLLTEFEISKDELNKLLADNNESLTDYRFIEELEWSVELYLENASKTPITDAELTKLLKKYNLTNAEFEVLLVENDDSLDNYSYVEDLDMALDYYINYADIELPEIGDLGITEEEIEKIMAYFETIDFDNPSFLEKVNALEEKYAFLEDWDFESAEDITEEQMAQIYELYQNVLDLFDIEIKFALSKDGKLTQVTSEEMMAMESTQGADLIIEIYTRSGELLVDMIFPYELLAEYETEEGPAEIVAEEVKDEVIQVSELIVKKKENNTVTGAKLPKTATNIGLYLILGFILFVAGAWIIRKMAVKGA